MVNKSPVATVGKADAKLPVGPGPAAPHSKGKAQPFHTLFKASLGSEDDHRNKKGDKVGLPGMIPVPVSVPPPVLTVAKLAGKSSDGVKQAKSMDATPNAKAVRLGSGRVFSLSQRGKGAAASSKPVPLRPPDRPTPLERGEGVIPQPAAGKAAAKGRPLSGSGSSPAVGNVLSGSFVLRPPPAKPKSGPQSATGGLDQTAKAMGSGLPSGVKLVKISQLKRSGSRSGTGLGSGPGSAKTHHSETAKGDATPPGWQPIVSLSGKLPVAVVTNGTAVDPSPLRENIVARAKLLTGPGGQDQFQIRLHPPQLGRVAVNMAWQQGGVSVTIVVSKEEVKQAMQSDLQGLKNSLAAAGVPLEGITVSLTGEGKDHGTGGDTGRRSNSGTGQQAKPPQAAQSYRPFPLAGASMNLSM